MSSAAKAKPVVLAVGVADAGSSEGNSDAADGDAGARVGEGEAVRLGVTLVDPQAASSSEVATANDPRMRSRDLWDNRTAPDCGVAIAASVAMLIIEHDRRRLLRTNRPDHRSRWSAVTQIRGAVLHR